MALIYGRSNIANECTARLAAKKFIQSPYEAILISAGGGETESQ
jgi:hypothetical protein